jgi:hypothetical protein
VYDNLPAAERLAQVLKDRFVGEEVWIVEVDTRHLARGPVFRAADLLTGGEGDSEGWVHEGEYLVMYRIPMQAVRGQTVIARGVGKGVGVIGMRP